MLQIKNLNVTHKKDLHTILTDFNFVLNPGDKAVIIGEEGNGKSTLLKWIYEPERVEDYVEAVGERICTRELLGYLPQELSELDKGKSLYEFFSEDPCFWEQTPRELGQLSSSLGLPMKFFYEEQKMGTLSGGEKVKAQMAKLLMKKPSVLLLDEPTRNFSPLSSPVIRKVLSSFGGAIISISHDRKYIREVCDKVYRLTLQGLQKEFFE